MYIRISGIMFGVWCDCLFVCVFQHINIDQHKHWWVLRNILVPPWGLPWASQQQETSLLNLFECIGSCQTVTTIIIHLTPDLSKHTTVWDCPGLDRQSERGIFYQKARTDGED